MITKVFVITAYSGEGEFEECCDMIQRQKDVDITHYIVKHQPIHAAFDEMYQAWEQVKHQYDFMTQIDADMVFIHDNVLINNINALKKSPAHNQKSAPVFDFYTDRNLWGWHIFDPTVRFNKITEQDKHRPDRVLDTSNLNILSSPRNEKAEVLHAHHPTLRSAFHFGWHRHLRGHKGVLNLVKAAQSKHKDDMRRHALAGADAAAEYMIQSGLIEHYDYKHQIEYTSNIFEQTFNDYKRKTHE